MPYKNKTSGIYVITNEMTGDQYVGSTVSLENRWYVHKHDAKRGRSSPLYRAIREYGADAFVFEILEACPKKMLERREFYWVGYLDTLYPNGYNIGSFKGAPSKKQLDQVPSDLLVEIGPYLREKRIRDRRGKDKEFDASERERRSRAAKKGRRRKQ